MRLQGVHDGRLYGTEYRTVVREASPPDGRFIKRGRLPAPATGREALSFGLRTSEYWKSGLERIVGRFPSVNVWPLTETDLLAAAHRFVFVSHDGGRSWSVSRRLPPSSSPQGVLPTGVCYHGGTVYLGEYPLDPEETPRILESEDEGETWTTAVELDGVRHVHAIQADPYADEIWVTTGDADEECRIGRLRDGRLETVGSGSQRWRAVELAFTPDAILWGMDSVYRESNPILRLDRSRIDDEPEPVYEAASSVFYAATLEVDSALWIVVSTAMEPGTDSTGPTDQTNYSDRASVLAASSATGFDEWHRLASYEKRSVPVDRWNPRAAAPVAGAYVFLATDPERGLFVNPHNTASDDGAVITYPFEYFAGLE